MSAPVAYSYVRFSSPQQAEGDSLRRQAEAAADWCRRHGARLDESATLRDLGRSAFTGAHRQNPDRHALAAFLKLVEAGRIPRGSHLIVESLDRLTREHIRPALTLVLNLIDAGIRVVQLAPVEAVYDDTVEPMQLMMCIMELSRGHSESATKSRRVGAAWREKKADARRDRKPITHKVPAWLRVEGDRLKAVEGRAAAVRRIYQLATQGYGIMAIARRLKAERVAAFGSSGSWSTAYVGKILAGREALGEYQPRRKGEPDGDPIPDFFPAIVTEQEWHAARGAMALRRKGGRPGGPKGRHLNLWQGLLFDGLTGRPLYCTYKGRGGPADFVIARRNEDFRRGRSPTFPLAPFEESVLAKLREIDPRDVLGHAGREGEAVVTLACELAGVEERLAGIVAQLAEVEGAAPSAFTAAAKQLDKRKAELAAALAEAQARAATPAAAAWGEFGTLADALAEAPDREAARVRLRGCLRAMVEGVHLVVTRVGLWQLLAAQFNFRGDGRRSYLIVHRRRHGVFGRKVPPVTRCWSFADAIPAADALDLRKREDAADLVETLEKLSPDDIIG
jgi:DNA invertase Pin-like site-specific DNA recombinase